MRFTGCFQHYMAYEAFKDLTRRTAPDKKLCNKEFNTAENPKYDGHQGGLASMVYKYFDKQTTGGRVKNEKISNKELAEIYNNQLFRKKIQEKKSTITFYRQYLGC